MMLATATVLCPLCGVSIPCPLTNEPTSEGLSFALDMAPVNEHYRMHQACTCFWLDGKLVEVSTTCGVHQ
jgi:hypothetical protein